MASASLVQDAAAVEALGVDLENFGNILDYRYKSRTPTYAMASNNTYTQKMVWDLSSALSQKWADLKNAYFAFDIKLTPTADLIVGSDFPIMAFKSSLLSCIQQVVVKSGGKQLCSETDELALANHLRLALEKDTDWLKSIAADLHFSRDRTESIIGLRNRAEINNPSISMYYGGPTGGVGQTGPAGPAPPVSNNYTNPAYNKGFHERQQYLARACNDDVGLLKGAWTAAGGVSFSVRIPLRSASDCLRAICDSGPMTADNLMIELYPNKGDSSQPVTLGSVVTANGGAPMYLPTGNTRVLGGPIKLSIDTSRIEPRLYFDEVTFRPDVNRAVMDRLNSGTLVKRLTWREYTVIRGRSDQLVTGNIAFNHKIGSGLQAVQRIWALLYPTDAGSQVTDPGWPSVLVTGPHGLKNVELRINGTSYFGNVFNSASDHYEALLNASHLSSNTSERECMIPFSDYRTTSRIHCFDVSRNVSLVGDPNASVEISLTATPDLPAGQGVEIVYVIEALRSGTTQMAGGSFTWEVGPAEFSVNKA